MPHLTAAAQFDPYNPRSTADQFTLLAQMRADAPVTFLPALHVYALTSPLFAYNPINVDKPLHSRLRDPLMAAFTIKLSNRCRYLGMH